MYTFTKDRVIVYIVLNRRSRKMMNEKEIKLFVGKRIKEERTKLKMTQKELGDIIGVQHNTISACEMGRNAPEQNAIFKIAETLAASVDELLPVRENKRSELGRARKKTDGLDMKEKESINKRIEYNR